MPRGKRHYRITIADALNAHRRALLTGGRDGVSDLGSIESAIARPYNGYYRFIALKAAALVQSVACNHGFVDGNKRTSLILTHTLLRESGYRLDPLPSDVSANEMAERMVLAVVTHKMEFDDIVSWFKARLRKIS